MSFTAAVVLSTTFVTSRRQSTGEGRQVICTEAVQYVIRDDQLHAVVKMRSNDGYAGFRNDFAWQKHVLEKLGRDLEVDIGTIFWCAGSLHFYEKDFYLIDHYNKTGKTNIKKSEYRLLYPNSDFAK